MTTRASLETRQRLVHDLCRVTPKRITEWRGCPVDDGAGRVNPYDGFVEASWRRQPRDVLFAELLVGDAVADAMILGDFEIIGRDAG